MSTMEESEDADKDNDKDKPPAHVVNPFSRLLLLKKRVGDDLANTSSHPRLLLQRGPGKSIINTI